MTVETTIVLAMLSTIFLGEYIEPTRYVKMALGIEHGINKTPASTPFKSKSSIKKRPMIGPINILVNELIKESFKEKTFNLVKAIPKDIKTRKIVA